jgi:dethiobiotin synthetase
MRGVFVTGTDTEVGKTILAAAICAALAERGEPVGAFKPVVTGLDEPPGDWPQDHVLLATTTGAEPGEVAPYGFGPPLSPHYAAELAGHTVEPARLLEVARAADGFLVCEGVGGLMVPLTTGYLIRDFALDLQLPLLIAARPGLGTISHSLMSVGVARTAGLEVAAVVITPWPDEPTPMEESNRATIARLGDVTVAGLPFTSPSALESAGDALPLQDWLEP